MGISECFLMRHALPFRIISGKLLGSYSHQTGCLSVFLSLPLASSLSPSLVLLAQWLVSFDFVLLNSPADPPLCALSSWVKGNGGALQPLCEHLVPVSCVPCTPPPPTELLSLGGPHAPLPLQTGLGRFGAPSQWPCSPPSGNRPRGSRAAWEKEQDAELGTGEQMLNLLGRNFGAAALPLLRAAAALPCVRLTQLPLRPVVLILLSCRSTREARV